MRMATEETVIERLLAFQAGNKWTLEKLAGELDVESSYLGRVLRGERPLSPRIELAAMKLLQRKEPDSAPTGDDGEAA